MPKVSGGTLQVHDNVPLSFDLFPSNFSFWLTITSDCFLLLVTLTLRNKLCLTCWINFLVMENLRFQPSEHLLPKRFLWLCLYCLFSFSLDIAYSLTIFLTGKKVICILRLPSRSICSLDIRIQNIHHNIQMQESFGHKGGIFILLEYRCRK